MKRIVPQPLNANDFAPFGDVIQLRDTPDMIINQGLCGRHHDLADIQIDDAGHAGISLFDAQPRTLPYELDLLERHPFGSQAFLPLSPTSFLVIVAPDDGGTPGRPQAFLTAPGQGINLHRNIWHGVLTPLSSPGIFAVIDRIGPRDKPDNNLQEYRLDQPYLISPAQP